MKSVKIASSLLIVALLAGVSAEAAPKAHKAASKSAKATSSKDEALDKTPGPVKKSNVSRDIRFNGSTVDGKYLSAGESIAEVEKEKTMGTLIGIRKNFRDKLNAENARLASGKGL